MTLSRRSLFGLALAQFLVGDALQHSVSEVLKAGTQNPIRFRTPYGVLALGFEATILADICDAVLAARKAGHLHHQQVHIAERCELLLRTMAGQRG